MTRVANRLRFEPLRVEHAAELFDVFRPPELYSFIPEKPPASLQAMEDDFKHFIGGPPEDSGEVWLNWAILERGQSAYVGTLQATVFSDGVLWIGYKLGPPHWGKGIATEGVRWLSRELQSRYPKLAIHASVDIRNEASIRVLTKVGFELARREPAELHGQESEDYIFVLPAPALTI